MASVDGIDLKKSPSIPESLLPNLLFFKILDSLIALFKSSTEQWMQVVNASY